MRGRWPTLFGLDCTRGLIGQTEKVGAELRSQSQQARGPGVQHGFCNSVAMSIDVAAQHRAFDPRTDRAASVTRFEAKGSGLCDQMPRCGVELAGLKKRFECEGQDVRRDPELSASWD